MLGSFKIFRLFWVTLLAAVTLLPLSALAAERTVIIGTAGVTGIYYPAGGAICRLLNLGRKEHGIRCSAESTGGSIANLVGLHDGDIDFGIVQSDWQYHAFHGSHEFEKAGPNPDIRFVFSLHSEPFALLVKEKSPIRTLDDLVGKRINVGAPSSGASATMQEVMRVKGWTRESFSQYGEMNSAELGPALCKDEFDALVFTSGHPNGALQDITALCQIRLVNIEGPEIDRLMSENPFYAPATIPGGMYQNNLQDVHTFGVKATLLTTAKEDEESVYELVKAVFDHFDNFKKLHPVFSTLDPVRMISEGNAAPMHPGAVRYFREKGLLSRPAGETPAEANTLPGKESEKP